MVFIAVEIEIFSQIEKKCNKYPVLLTCEHKNYQLQNIFPAERPDLMKAWAAEISSAGKPCEKGIRISPAANFLPTCCRQCPRISGRLSATRNMFTPMRAFDCISNGTG